MPYIKQEMRPELDAALSHFPQLDEPELDYVITKLCLRFIKDRERRFVTMNKVMGILSCAAFELYRRVIGPYEDEKVRDNGDVEDFSI